MFVVEIELVLATVAVGREQVVEESGLVAVANIPVVVESILVEVVNELVVEVNELVVEESVPVEVVN